MGRIKDFAALEKIDIAYIIEWVEANGYQVISEETILDINSALLRASKLAYDKGRYKLHKEIKRLTKNVD